MANADPENFSLEREVAMEMEEIDRNEKDLKQMVKISSFFSKYVESFYDMKLRNDELLEEKRHLVREAEM